MTTLDSFIIYDDAPLDDLPADDLHTVEGVRRRWRARMPLTADVSRSRLPAVAAEKRASKRVKGRGTTRKSKRR